MSSSEQALRESLAFQRALLEALPDFIFVLDADGVIQQVNRVQEGQTEQEVVGQKALNFVPPDHHSGFEDALQRALDTNQVQTVETSVDLPDGRHHLLCRLSPVALVGMETSVILISTDITGRKLAEQALAESEANFRTFFSTSDGMIAVARPDGQILYANAAVSKKLGYEEDELYFMKLLDLHPQELRDKARNFISVCTHGVLDSYPLPLASADGARIPAESRVWRGKWNNEDCLFFSAKDLTEQQKVVRELRQIRMAVDATGDAIGIATAEGDHFYQNETFTRLFGYAIEDFASMPPAALYADAEVARLVFETIMSGGDWDGEIEMVAKGGRRFPVHLRANAVKDDDGEVIALIGAHTDITERVRAKEALETTNSKLAAANVHLEQQTTFANKMAAEAERASAAKSEFLANMSHEIRTPMNGVLGMTSLLLETDLDDEQRRYTKTVKASADSLLGLINDILDFSKIEAGQLEMETIDFDLRSLLDDFAEMFAIRTQDKGLELLCAASPQTPGLLRGDPGRLRQVLFNLAGNALKFTEAGEIAVRASVEAESSTEAVLRFSVRDTGIGIPADKRDALFDKFTQVDASTTRKYGGTGLGLAISRQLAELMGGEIGVDSEEGQGSEFWFSARFLKQPARALEVLTPVDLRGARVLVVDDNATNREIVLAQLTAWGTRPGEAPDGDTCLRLLREAAREGDPYQVALLDMQMPGMDGAELGRCIKTEQALADVRLMMMTSQGCRGDARRFEEVGFAAYLTKPVRQSDLFDSLSVVLTGEQPRARRPIVTRHMVREIRRHSTRILLVEDNSINQQVALAILGKLGFAADLANNGAEALEALQAAPYDLVFMDVQMPVMDWLEATARVRDARSEVLDHDVPIIAMTAHAMQGDRERCLEAGMDDYISKPIEPAALSEALEQWLTRLEQRRTARGEPARGETSSPPGPVEPPVFAEASFVERLMGDSELASIVVQSFLDDIPARIEALVRCLDSGDMVGAKLQAHTIKGASGNVSAEALSSVAHDMEQAGQAGDLEQMQRDLPSLQAQFDRLRQAMQASALIGASEA